MNMKDKWNEQFGQCSRSLKVPRGFHRKAATNLKGTLTSVLGSHSNIRAEICVSY